MSKPHKLDKRRRQRVVEAVSAGLTREQQAAYAGCARSTLQDAIARGRADSRGIWHDWVAELEEAEARAIVANIALIQRSARDGTWQAAAWLLERRYPQQFGRYVRTENRTEHRGSITTASAHKTDEELDEEIAELEARVGAEGLAVINGGD